MAVHMFKEYNYTNYKQSSGIRNNKQAFQDDLQKAMQASLVTAQEQASYDEDLAQALRASKEEHDQKIERLVYAGKRCQTDEEALNIALELSRCVTTLEGLTNEFKKTTGPALSVNGKVKPNPGGGNCQFYTLRDCISPDYHYSAIELRRLAVTLILLQWDRFAPFAQKMNGDALPTQRQYAEYMGKEGNWGDHLSLLILCEHFRLHAVVHVHKNSINIGTIHINEGGSKVIHIKFWQECHYEAIV